MSTQGYYRARVPMGRSAKGSLKTHLGKLWHNMAYAWTLPSSWRVALYRMMGVSFDDPKRVFLGDHVLLDRLFPHNISIGSNVLITEGVMILAHFYDPSFDDHVMRVGPVRIEDDVMIGMRAMVVNAVTIGKGAVVAANSVVTRDVPPGAVVAGSPAKVVGQRGDTRADTVGELDQLQLGSG